LMTESFCPALANGGAHKPSAVMNNQAAGRITF